ncbi:surface lipoprotein assembly modifier [Marinobacterium jannaschii]|uniref:surface lipoprotein assembly modifier n=1 Tax=Marinobacterium jannaschii TaxID=64970 RepID=UPI000ACFFBA7|nr:surface lipoprotein assembly modifier [Marinobacterium jannaschii]
MNHFKRYLSFVSFSLLVSTAQADTQIEQLTSLVNQGDMAAAYDLAQQLQPEYEGDPAFDLQYGIAAIDNGDIGQGMFALERVLVLRPDMHLARLELARGYFLQGNDLRAKEQFNAVLENNPPPKVVDQIQAFLNLIASRAEKSRWSAGGSLQLAWGYDDNINAAPESQTTVVTLSDTALGRGDQFTTMKLNGHAEYQATKAQSWFGNATLESRWYADEDPQDFRNLRGLVGSRWLDGRNRYQLALNAQNYQLDNNDYRDSYGVGGQWTYALSKTAIVTTSLDYSQLDYDTADWKDSDLVSLGVNGVIVGNGHWTPVYFAGGFAGREKPDSPGVLADAGVDRLFFGGHIGARIEPYDGLQLTTTLVAQRSNYRGTDFIYNIRRDDNYLALALDASWKLPHDWRFISGISYSRNDSNIELHDYDRTQVRLGVQYQF